MKKEKFVELWDKYAPQWYEKAVVHVDGCTHQVSEYCEVKDEYGEFLYETYEDIKHVTKKLYFESEENRVNRFKRAAILMYAINIADPLLYKNEYSEDDVEIGRLFLKQRLAFYIAQQSIIVQYPKNVVQPLIDERMPLYDLDIVSHGVGDGCSDTFTESIYKDLFFSGIYQNFNVLTMANVFVVLTERSSKLRGLSLNTSGEKR